MFKAAFALGALEQSFSGSFAGRFLEASWRRCHSSSEFSLSQFVLFLHVIPDRLMMIRSDLCVEHWLFPTDTLQQKIEIADLKPFLSVVKILVF